MCVCVCVHALVRIFALDPIGVVFSAYDSACSARDGISHTTNSIGIGTAIAKQAHAIRFVPDKRPHAGGAAR